MSEQWMCIGKASEGRILKSKAKETRKMQNRRAVIDFCSDFFKKAENADKRIDSYDADKKPSEPRYWTCSAVRHPKFPTYTKKHPDDYIPYNNNPDSVLNRERINHQSL